MNFVPIVKIDYVRLTNTFADITKDLLNKAKEAEKKTQEALYTKSDSLSKELEAGIRTEVITSVKQHTHRLAEAFTAFANRPISVTTGNMFSFGVHVNRDDTEYVNTHCQWTKADSPVTHITKNLAVPMNTVYAEANSYQHLNPEEYDVVQGPHRAYLKDNFTGKFTHTLLRGTTIPKRVKIFKVVDEFKPRAVAEMEKTAITTFTKAMMSGGI